MSDTTAKETSDGGETTTSTTPRRYLLLIEKDATTRCQLPAEGELILGRADDSDIRLQDRVASRHHAKLLVTLQEVEVLDLDSKNGTFVNGERISARRTLSNGDVLQICKASLFYCAELRPHRNPTPCARSELQRSLDRELARAHSFGRSLSLLCLVPVLSGISRADFQVALAACLHPIDIFCWDGEDSILLLAPELEGSSLMQQAARLMSALAPTFPAMRIGAAAWPTDGNEADTLISVARAAAAEAVPGMVRLSVDLDMRISIPDLEIVIAEPAMLRQYEILKRVAGSDSCVLLTGETGVGKEVAARALHHFSLRSGPFRVVPCATIAEQAAESELFGHSQGSFAQAVSARSGLLESAGGGTIVLDDIDSLSSAVQAKLLHAVEHRSIRRIGEDRERPFLARLVVTSQRDLEDEVAHGRFRADLYYRLNVVKLHLSPLRDRRRELPKLLLHFLQRACTRAGLAQKAISAEAMCRLLSYVWPGNVREAANLMDALAQTAEGAEIEWWHLPPKLHHLQAAPLQPLPFNVERAALRRILIAVLPRDSDLVAFCLDYFPEVHQHFTDGMDRVQRISLLLEMEDSEEILRRLREREPTRFLRHQRLLKIDRSLNP
jgi:DNA-binding NtrC family response regulator